jgi:hypothetical protein
MNHSARWVQTPEISEFDSAEEVLLRATERVSNDVYERFTMGSLDRTQLKEAYRLLSDWTNLSKELIELMGRA